MGERKRIYLDHNATTPVDARVLEAMLPYFSEKFGNAASKTHSFGYEAEAAVEESRAIIAGLIGADSREIVFTSGATESDNIAVRGIAEVYSKYGKHVITSPVEHKAVIDSMRRLEKMGFEVTWLPVDRQGMVELDALRNSIRKDTILVSLMAANNETGNISPVAEIGEVIKEKNPRTVFHTDATQAFGKIPLDVNEMKIDLASFSAHKIYGPKGTGGLYVRRRNPKVKCVGIIDGGGHERGLRSGTLNVPGIVGLAEAARLMHGEMEKNDEHTRRLRDLLHGLLAEELDEIHLNGHPEHRLPTTVNLSFAYVEGEAIMLKVPEIAVSSGSACSSASLEPSYVLRAMGVPDELAHSAIRFSLGRENTEEDIRYAAKRIIQGVKQLRELSPLYDMALKNGKG